MIGNLIIVILNMNLKDDTLELIHSLLQAGSAPEQIILVDNGSSDGSVQAIRETFSTTLHVIENSENVGFAAGNNQGFELAYQMGAQWVLLLNNDTIVATDFFDQVDIALLENKDYQIFAPAIYYYSDPEILWHLGSTAIPGTLLARNCYQGHPLPANLPDLMPVDYISGCAMLIQRDVYEKIGLFDEQFFAYWEEVDFCFRARKAGFRIGVFGRGKIWHKVSKTANQDKSQKHYLYHRNMIYYVRKNAMRLQRPIMTGYLLIRFLATFVQDLIGAQKQQIHPLLSAWVDGWRNPVS